MTRQHVSRRSWIAVFYAHTTLLQAIAFVLRPTASYQALALDLPAHWLGALGASFAVVPLILAVPTGHAADRFGERRIALVGSGLVVLSAVGFVTVGATVPGLLVATVLLGTGY